MCTETCCMLSLHTICPSNAQKNATIMAGLLSLRVMGREFHWDCAFFDCACHQAILRAWVAVYFVIAATACSNTVEAAGAGAHPTTCLLLLVLFVVCVGRGVT